MPAPARPERALPIAVEPPPPDASAEHFVLELSRALHEHGAPSHRLEEAMARVCRRLGLEAQLYATPTALIVAFGRERPETHLVRIHATDIDLRKLAALDEIAARIDAGTIGVDEGLRAVRRIERDGPLYRAPLLLLCQGLAAAGAARFFGGGPSEVAASLLIGLCVGALSMVATRLRPGFNAEPFAAFSAAVLSMLLAAAAGPISVPVTTLASIIVLIPGYTLTDAVIELATRNLASGTARLTGGVMTLVYVFFGVVLGTRAGEVLLGPAVMVVPPQLPGWTELLALLATALAFGVLFQAHWRDLGWVSLASAVAYGGSRLGAHWLGPELGSFVGAFALGISANAYGRLRNRPAAVPMVPAMMLLVPGSVGFRALTLLLARDVVSGVQTAFTMLLIAVAIVSGLLSANQVLPPRRPL